MRFRIDPWSVDYGASVESELAGTEVAVDPAIEVAPDAWAPIAPDPAVRAAPVVLFVDGVRRIDARIWIEDGAGDAVPGVCASYAAGVVRCAPGVPAAVERVRVGRGLFSVAPQAAAIETRHGAYLPYVAGGPSPEELWLALQARMGRLEIEAAEAARHGPVLDGSAGTDALVVVDGPLSGRGHIGHAVGVVKSHSVAYLPPDLQRVVGRLGPGERTPVFAIGGRFTRHSWYLRLPGGVDAPWAGVVRVESAADGDPAAVGELAGVIAATLPRFASEPYKDARAPQNLVPIGGLERELRRRLGDPALMYRALRVAAGAGRDPGVKAG
jgi:hypothetical protein